MFTGVLTALVTPMRGGEIDLRALAELTEWQVACGVDGLVPAATTGESATLTPEERLSVIRTVAKTAAGRVPVVAGAGSSSTRVAIDLARSALEIGVDGLLVVCPYYNKPTQAGLKAHFRAILEAVDAPLVLYNIPGRTGVDMQVGTFVELAAHPRVVGIKEATGQVTRAAELVQALEGKAAVLAGDDALFLPVLAVGGLGIVSATASVAPREMVSVMRAFERGDLAAARASYLELLDLFSALFAETNPGPAKAALHLMGRIAPEVRLPLCWPAEATIARVRAVLAAKGLLPT
jgi:4-hydroxy-tetrahydrodipicolinate synthase